MDEDKKPFNDAIDHMNKIEGNVSNLANADLKKLPRPYKIFWLLYGWFLFNLNSTDTNIKLIKINL